MLIREKSIKDEYRDLVEAELAKTAKAAEKEVKKLKKVGSPKGPKVEIKKPRKK